MFGKTNNVVQEFIHLIEASIKDRINNICDTWDAQKVMSLPWGVKEEVNPDNAKDVGDYFLKIVETTIALPSYNEIQILKAELKERKGKYILIARYQILKQA